MHSKRVKEERTRPSVPDERKSFPTQNLSDASASAEAGTHVPTETPSPTEEPPNKPPEADDSSPSAGSFHSHSASPTVAEVGGGDEAKLFAAQHVSDANRSADAERDAPTESQRPTEEPLNTAPAADDSSTSAGSSQSDVTNQTVAGTGGVNVPSLDATHPIGRSTGPRTPQGKQRSKMNATKHGILSKYVVLKGESLKEYESLVQSLCDCFQPRGKMEEIEVGKIAMDSWRQRRLVQAELAETEERALRSEVETRVWRRNTTRGSISDPKQLEVCVRALKMLRYAVETEGLNEEAHKAGNTLLRDIYGDPDFFNPGKDVCDVYTKWARISQMSNEERQKEGYDLKAFQDRLLNQLALRLSGWKNFRKRHLA